MYIYKAKVNRIVDADTWDITIDLGFGIFFKERIRLARVDTPEIYGVKKESAEYKAGVAAADFVKDWLDKINWNIVIKTEKDKKGKYGRYLAEVYKLNEENDAEFLIASTSLNDELLEEGHAVLYD